MPKPYNPNDKLMQKAKREGYRARSVYKLIELDNKFHLFRSGIKVLDIGAAPGSWLQYISDKIEPNGQALGLDLKQIMPISENVTTLICDITDTQLVEKNLQSFGWDKVDIIISDIAPNTSGIAHSDHTKSIELNQKIFQIAKNHLTPRGKLIMKVFPGSLFFQFTNELKKYFRHVLEIRVSASRDRSKEIYLVCY